MKPIKESFWVKIEKEVEDTIEIGGMELYRDTSYDPMKLTRQYGIVYATPAKPIDGVDVQEGDKIWFHHFVASDVNKVEYIEEENIYHVWINQAYMVERDGVMIPIGNWNFVSQEIQGEQVSSSGLITSHGNTEVLHRGDIIYMNDWMKEQGVEKGDRVVFTENSEYDMDINGVSLLRMRNLDILGTYEG